MITNKISVVVCTYNRCNLLEDIVKNLIDQTIDNNYYEIIVVDNNSTDNTKNIVGNYITKNPEVNLRYILETKQGLSHARNRGWNEGKGNYVAYIDDDCRAPEKWLEVAIKIIENHSPAIFGGPYYAFYNSPKPKWFKDSYGSMTRGDKAHTMQKYEFLSGGNIFFRKSLLQKIGGFNPKLGMVGKKLAYGEETALQILVRESMSSELIYYDPELLVYHLVRTNKMSLRWRLKYSFSDGRYSYILFKATNKPMGKIILKSLYLIVMIVYAILVTPLKDKNKYPYIENYLCEKVFQYISQLGLLYEQLNQKKK